MRVKSPAPPRWCVVCGSLLRRNHRNHPCLFFCLLVAVCDEAVFSLDIVVGLVWLCVICMKDVHLQL